MGTSLSNEIVKRSVPFIDLKDFTPLIDFCKDKKVVMLGESTHGTKEFYEWRSLITAELIQKHGFNFIAVEGDWPACREVDRFIRHQSSSRSIEALSHFTRWPTWMWRNAEMIEMLDWLKEWNLNSTQDVGFHGLDIYSLYESIDEVIAILNKEDPQLADKYIELFNCFEPYHHDEKEYSKALFNFPKGCEQEVKEAITGIIKKSLKGFDYYFDLRQNARVIQNAENYYRSVVFEGRANSWNLRDRHMMETLEALMDHYGKDSRTIVWAHNSHIGDYRATDMVLRGQVNLGGLARKKYGMDQVALVGFTTYTGSVIASHAWSGPVEILEVPEAKSGSLESVLNESIPMVGHPNYYLIFEQLMEGSPLLDLRGHRAIGVVYEPNSERRRNYVPTAVGERYDALVFINETKALSPLGIEFDRSKMPETYPFGNRL